MKKRFIIIYSSFIVSLSILLVLSFLFFERLSSLLKYSASIDHTYTVINRLENLESMLYNMESGQRGFIITKDSNYLRPFTHNLSMIKPLLDSLATLVDADDSQKHVLQLLKSAITERVSLLKINMNKVIENDTIDLAPRLNKGRTLMIACDDLIERMKNKEKRTLAEMFGKQQFYENLVPRNFLGILGFVGLITMVSFFFIIRQFSERIKYQGQLEKRVNELNRTNAELEQFTYVASHDLQEPLRKIRTFSDRLIQKHNHQLDETGKMILGRIDVSAHRIQQLLQDMVLFTNLIHKPDRNNICNLNFFVNNALQEYHDIIETNEAVVTMQELPVIPGYADQLQLLFKVLIDNALKFAKENSKPEINFSYKKVQVADLRYTGWPTDKKEYHQISISDKGIGFDNEFANKIFMIFQRLHNQESVYSGKGIGLAIAQKIMINHDGFITAKGVAGEGATFTLYFPIA